MTVKAPLTMIKKRRLVKQYIFGSLFVILLGLAWLFPLLGYFIPLCMIGGIGYGLFQGRKWCDWFCPRGAFADSFLKTLSPGKPIPAIMRTVPFRLAVLSFLMIMLATQIIRLWPDWSAIGHFFVILLTITTIAAVLLALPFHQRSWCTVCPIGFLSGIVGKNRKPLTMDRAACVSCLSCDRICPMNLNPSDLKESPVLPQRGDCLKCGLCVASCPKKALTFQRRSRRADPEKTG